MKKTIISLAFVVLCGASSFAVAIEKANVGPITCEASQLNMQIDVDTLTDAKLDTKYAADINVANAYMQKDCTVDTDKLLAAMLPFVKDHLYKDCRDKGTGGGRCCYIDPDDSYKLVCTPFLAH